MGEASCGGRFRKAGAGDGEWEVEVHPGGFGKSEIMSRPQTGLREAGRQVGREGQEGEEWRTSRFTSSPER